MAQTNCQSDLTIAITAFETSLNTPIVSGELDEWVAEVQKTWAEASVQIQYDTQHLHARQFQEMTKVDPELLPRVDLLKKEDVGIEQQWEQLKQAITRTAQHLPKLEPDEEKAEKHVKQLVDEGLAFVARVRKQEVAIETWFVEAFNRDRGESG